MVFSSRLARAALPCAATLLAFVSNTRDAGACGGCFHPKTEAGSSVITDHRMVFKISTKETILWDQVRYAGDPTEFAWVLPVHDGARVELSRDEWIAALDGATRTTVKGPEISCNAQPSSTGRSASSSSSSSSSSGGGGGGCAGGSDDSWSPPPSTTDESGSSSGSGGTRFAGNEEVEVVSQSVIGPYQAVTIRASQGDGIAEWLTANGFDIPKEVAPVVEAYTREKFDFIALRLRPGVGVRAMRPVRVVTPGADTTLPLRMVAAGVGAHVGLTLWVIGEGRYHTTNFPDAPIDYGKLAWDGTANRSNLTQLQKDALAANGGRGWLTEAAIRANVTTIAYGQTNPTLYDAYTRQCTGKGTRYVPCDETALPPSDGMPEGDPADAGDAGDADGGLDAGDGGLDAGDGGSDAGAACTKAVSGCDGFDDLDVAIRGLHTTDVWVTRLRADLPVTALATDLELGATGVQNEDNPARRTTAFTDAAFDPCARANGASGSSGPLVGDEERGCACRTPARSRDTGSFFLIGLTALGAILIARRRS